jgi:large subunit ribosomal protein L14
MLQKNSYVTVYDNSGAKKAQCIHIYGGYRKRYARIGDTILVSVKSVRKTKKPEDLKIQKGDIFKAIVLSTKSKNFFNADVSVFYNGVALMTNQKKFLGSRVFVPLFKNFRYSKNLKLLSICPGLII